jgi:16S rRNA processing protein RimM
VKGWVHVQSFTDPPAGLLRYGSWTLRMGLADRSERRLLEGREHGRGVVARLEGVEDRTAAAALAGATIEVARSALPKPARRQFYRVDLIGLAVRNEQGAELGTVSHFIDTPANAVMVVQGDRERWIPATPRHIRKVDLRGGWVAVDWPAEEE